MAIQQEPNIMTKLSADERCAIKQKAAKRRKKLQEENNGCGCGCLIAIAIPLLGVMVSGDKAGPGFFMSE